LRPDLAISVVVINHNYLAYLREAVESALVQTHKPAEIVVVDDGSTDGSQALIRGFGNRVVPVLQNASGHVAALNAGFAASRGDIVIFLDADDRLDPVCLAHVAAHWHATLAKLQYRLATIDGAGQDQALDFPYFPPDLTPAALRAQALRSGVYPWPVSSGNAYARSFLTQLLPIDPQRVFKSPDGYLNKMAPLFGEVASLNRVLGDYRVHGRNAWAQGGAGHLNEQAIARAVRFDALLQDEFAARAAARGHAVQPYRTCPHPPMLEYRMLSLRLAPGTHPLPDDRRFPLLRLALAGLRDAPNLSLAGRVFWAAWFVALAALPAGWVRRLFTAMRGQLHRPAWSRLVVGMSRGVAARSFVMKSL
jgi:hypothetical protein